ncbi:MAG TPA: hypothetical protein VJP88_05265, partial [Caulobacteraceae bacterium]|nr:hypothetical protein [Caulobacteraceae bacterium]
LNKTRSALVTEPEAQMTPAEQADFGRHIAQAGWGGTDLSQNGMDAAQKRLGNVFNDVAEKTSLDWKGDDQLRTDIGQAIHDAAQTIPESQLPPLFKQLDDIVSTANDGRTISGQSYQQLTRSGGPLATLMRDNGAVGVAARQIREALDDGLERSLTANPPADGSNPLADLQTARLQYKNLKTVEGLLPNAGVDNAVTPERLLAASRRAFSTSARTGAGPLGDLAEATIRERGARAPAFEQDAGQLFALRDNLQSSIDKLSARGETNDAARAAASRLTTVRDALDQSLERANPDYTRFRQIADSSAEPIEAQRYLQSLPLTTNGPRGGTVTLNLVNKALDRIETGRSQPGPHPAKLVSQSTIDQLRALQADLERQSNAELGKAKGSPTNQLGTSQAEFAGINVPMLAVEHAASHVPVLGPHIVGAVREASDNANRRVLQALANRLVNPEPLTLPGPTIPNATQSRIVRAMGVLPGATGGMVASRLLGSH